MKAASDKNVGSPTNSQPIIGSARSAEDTTKQPIKQLYVPLQGKSPSMDEFDEVNIILASNSQASVPSEGRSEGRSEGSAGGSNSNLRQQFTMQQQLRQQRKAKSKHQVTKFKLFRRQLYTVFWTNLLMRYRMKIVTIFEILLPVLTIYACIAGLTSRPHWTALSRLKSDSDASQNPTVERSQEKLQTFFCSSETLCVDGKAFIVFTPNTEFTRTLLTKAMKLINVNDDSNHTNLIGVATPDKVTVECKQQFEKSIKNKEIPEPIGIIFKFQLNKTQEDNREIPSSLTYTIRTFLSEIANTIDLFPYIEIPNEDGISSYIKTGFVGLQSAIDSTFIELLAKQSESRGDAELADFRIGKPTTVAREFERQINLQMFPYTVYLDLKVRYSTWAAIMFSIILGYFCTTYFTLNRLILHRTAGILKMLKLHGMSTTLHWLALLFYEIMFHAITCVGIVLILFYNVTREGGLLQHDNPTVVFIFLYLHGVASSCFCLFISYFFTRPTFGAAIGFMISFLTYFIPMNLYLYGYIQTKLLNSLLCILFPNWALANGLYQFLQFESFDDGVDWNSLAAWNNEQHILFPSGFCILIFVITSIFYFSLTVLMKNFSLIIQTLKGKGKKITVTQVKRAFLDLEEDALNVSDFDKPPVYEDDLLNPCYVKLRNVSVVYQNAIAIDNVSLNFHEGQITLVLGYNDSGKSTLLQVTAGLVCPTSGIVSVNGSNPFTRSSQLNKKIGFCTKALSLFPSLSVEEHIRLCCMLHGYSIAYSKATTTALLKTFKLYDYRRMGVKYISQHQLRKLGLAMAMSNNCKVLILEEPTFQMTDDERHELWASLQNLKKNRTIIISMGSLEDGDAYADRLVLMSNGKVICAGSPSFLNKAYDIGTFLKVRKVTEEVVVGQILFFIQLLYPKLGDDFHEVKLSGNEEQEHYIYLNIPRSLKLSSILHTIESYKDELGVSEVHVIHNTLAGIFYKLSKTNKGISNSTGVFQEKRESIDEFISKLVPKIELPKIPKEIQNQYNSRNGCCSRLSALFQKHSQYAKQKYWNFLCEFIVSFILVGVFIYFCQSYLTPQPSTFSRQLGITTYKTSALPIHLVISPESEEISWRDAFKLISEDTQNRFEFYSSKATEEEFKGRLIPKLNARTNLSSQVVTAIDIPRSFEQVTGFYASNARHSAPVTFNIISNVFLRIITPRSARQNNISYKVTTFNHPFIWRNGTGITIGTVFSVTNCIAGVIFSILLGLIAASRIVLPLVERQSGLKYIEMMTGVRVFEYWLAFFIFDVCVCALASIIIITIVILFDTSKALPGLDSKGLILLLSAMYLCWTSLPFSYLFSRLITNPYSGFGHFMICHIFIGILPAVVLYLLYGRDLTGFYYYLRFILHIFPSYTMTSAFIILLEQIAERNFCEPAAEMTDKKCSKPPTIFTNYINTDFENGVDMLVHVIIMCGQGVFYWIILTIFETKITTIVRDFFKSMFQGDIEITKAIEVDHHALKDPDVLHEQEQVIAIIDTAVLTPPDDLLIVGDITKVTANIKILDHIYFRMPKGTIVGILGHDDSGKQELIQTIIGAIKFTHGSIILNKISLLPQNHKAYLKQIGYSPIKAPLIEHLSGLQMVELIGRLRGIPSQYLTIQAKKWLVLLGIPETVQIKKCSSYSKGLQMRLSFAMALIGTPRLIVFDEPTKFLSDNEKVLFFNLLTFLRKQGQSIILTSSSAEECSQICTKLILLCEGAIMAIGTPQSVFTKYPKGWSLVIRLFHDISTKYQNEQLTNMKSKLINFALNTFSPCELLEDKENLVTFYLAHTSKTLSFMYGHMEEIKTEMPDFIDDYFIQEANIDDIILEHPGDLDGEEAPESPPTQNQNSEN